MTLTEFLKGIADAIRAKKGTTASINAQDFATEILNLPSGGSGGGETCTGTIKGNGPMGTEGVLYYTDGSSTSQEIADVGTISVVKNSFIVANGKGMTPSFSGSGISVLYDSLRMIGVWFVTGDFTIKI